MDGQPAAPAPSTATPARTRDSNDGNLDTALLETIFYNEMMLMDESSSLSSDFLAYLASDQSQSGAPSTPTPAPVDASAIAERALLSDFGVASEPAVGKTEASQPGWVAPAKQLKAPAMQMAQPSSAGAQAPVTHQPLAPTCTFPPVAASLPHVPAPAPLPPQAPTTQATAVSKERAHQLVSQFATLASRLGISLPPNVLSSLTDAAAINEEAKRAASASGGLPPSPMLVPSKPAPVTSNHPATTCTASATPVSSMNEQEPTPEVVKRLRNMAEEAIAAVSENRKRSQSDPQQASAKPLYSKRRKKPRLSDCEAKLASLREENEMLKRHLDTVQNQSSKFEAERKRTEQEMKTMIKEGAEPEKLNPVLHKYSEMYSDYGRHRNQELLFHLQQLEKLAAPTNFTKMGLWTLGQSEGFYTNPKENPIAGILRKELGITPAQGRKILEQRQKIRDVCNNLKQCLMLLGKLKTLCEHKQKVFHDRMSKCQEILTPPQAAKLLLWVDEHSHLLESVCPGWGSERIRTKETPKAHHPST